MKKSGCRIDRLLAAAVVAAAGVILWGALFLIAPIWQFRDPAAPYQSPASAQDEPTQAGDAAGPVNVNTADAEALAELPGIGPAKADAIIAYREEHGPFASLAELDEVKGISARMTESWAGLATVGTQESPGTK